MTLARWWLGLAALVAAAFLLFATIGPRQDGQPTDPAPTEQPVAAKIEAAAEILPPSETVPELPPVGGAPGDLLPPAPPPPEGGGPLQQAENRAAILASLEPSLRSRYQHFHKDWLNSLPMAEESRALLVDHLVAYDLEIAELMMPVMGPDGSPPQPPPIAEVARRRDALVDLLTSEFGAEVADSFQAEVPGPSLR